MSEARERAIKLLETARAWNWRVDLDGPVLKITKHFAPGDNDAFVDCDMEYDEILSWLPSTSAGSVWGTDGGGVGAISAINSGTFQMKKSGGSKRVLKEIEKNISKYFLQWG
tara:strand:+ start:914 stop:1249 length:336 start_codon:yes stop_codon:yes gene_type:complete